MSAVAPVDDAIKAEILARTDLAAYIGTYVQLQRRGRDLVGLCPFHSERTPSFFVHPDRNFWKCFGCQKGGDAINFAMERDGLQFPEALRALADRVGIRIDNDT